MTVKAKPRFSATCVKNGYLMMNPQTALSAPWRSIAAMILALVCVEASAQHAVIVCPVPMQRTLEAWIQHRHDQGITSVVIAPRFTADQTTSAIRKASTDQTRYVVIVGDAPVIGTAVDLSAQTPIHYRPTTVTAAWQSTPTLSTDLPYGDLDGDGQTDASVGRLPVDNADQLGQAITKILHYEKSAGFSAWRNRVSLVGGVGGFGLLIDSAIETVTRSVVTGVLPSHVETAVRFASPGHAFFPKQQSFTQTILNDFSQGSRFWVYAGHGQITELDRVPRTGDGVPVLDSGSAKKLAAPQHQYPIALLLACYCGAMDAREDSIAEQMWSQPGGPIAVVAGCRVTMPYGNTSAALGLIDAVYQKQSPRLGDAWLASVHQMEKNPVGPESSVAEPSVSSGFQAGDYIGAAAIDPSTQDLIDGLAAVISPPGSDLHAERREHAMLYNLIGDPTLQLLHPEKVSIAVAAGHDPSTPVDLRLTSSIDGLMTISLHRPLGWATEGDPNERTLATMSMQVTGGQTVHPQILPPSDVVGPLVVRVHVAGSEGWATAAAKTRIR